MGAIVQSVPCVRTVNTYASEIGSASCEMCPANAVSESGNSVLSNCRCDTGYNGPATTDRMEAIVSSVKQGSTKRLLALWRALPAPAISHIDGREHSRRLLSTVSLPLFYECGRFCWQT
jgi:hypothetical protein